MVRSFKVRHLLMGASAICVLWAVTGCEPKNQGADVQEQPSVVNGFDDVQSNAIGLEAARDEKIDPSSWAKSAAEGVAKVTSSSIGYTGDPVYVIPESHSSRRGQLEEALILYRLNNNRKLSSVVLEGMSPELREDDLGVSNLSSPSVGLQLVKEGDIGSAEFMAKVFGTRIIAGETEETYKHADVDQIDFCEAIVDIAVSNLTKTEPTLSARYLAASTAADSAIREAEKDPAKIRAAKAAVNAKFALWPRVLTKFPNLKAGRECNPNDRSRQAPQIEDEIASANESIEFAKDASVSLKNQSLLTNNLGGLKARDAASVNMGNLAINQARSRSGPLAIIIGSAHERHVVTLLREARVPYSVIANNALLSRSEQDVMTGIAWRRKQIAAPVVDSALNRALTEDVQEIWGNSHHKPPTTLQMTWLKSKADIYESAADFSESALKGTQRTYSGPYAVDTNQAKTFTTNGRKAVVFPINIQVPPGNRQETIWLAAREGRAEPALKKADKDPTESEILDAAEGSHSETAVKLIDKGEIQISKNVRMKTFASRELAEKFIASSN